MAKKQLTELGIRKLPVPETGQKTYWEDGFGVRVSQGGTKTYVVMYGQKPRKQQTLGRFGDISLSEARKAAKRILSQVHVEQRPDSLAAARAAYLKECEVRTRPSTLENYRHYLSKIDTERLRDIKRTDIDHGHAHMVTAWKVFMNWCLRRELIDRNPFAFIPVTYNERSRYLSDEEIKKVWAYDWPPYSDYIKLSLLTGQRIGQWQDYTVTDDTIVFPARIMKGGKEHTIPLLPMTAKLLPVAKFNGWSKGKVRMDIHTGVTGYRVHDLRRTFSTTMASLQVPLHVTEAILDHRSGSISGVARTYNRYNYLKEMRLALEAYEAHLTTIVT